MAARAELDEGLRAEMYRDIQIILRDEGGNIVPMFANEVHARNEKIAHGDLSWVRGFDGPAHHGALVDGVISPPGSHMTFRTPRGAEGFLG